MERILSTEDKIRRAEEIYNRRRENNLKNTTAKVNINSKKDLKLLKKMFIQIIVCMVIYSIFFIVKNNNYIFSEDFINKSKEILSYDIDFKEIYNQIIIKLQDINSNLNKNHENQENKEKNEETNEDKNENTEENGIGGAEENKEDSKNEENKELSEMEKDALDIKNTVSFINPIEGTITSRFGWRNPTTTTVPKYHTGLDIANIVGTKILSATDGEVILASTEGDYRKTFKNTNSRYSNYICSL